jgi:ABC-type oligopeptide transport system substrate-binding subunit
MAYMSQEHKAKLAPTIKAICKKYNVKASLAVRNHSTLVLTVKQGDIDFIGDFGKLEDAAKFGIQINPYWYHEHFTGRAREFLSEIIPAMYGPDYFDHSDAMTDYFHCSHYIDVNIGRWDQPYALIK